MQDILTFINNHLLLSIVFLVVLFAVFIMEFIKQKQSAASLSPVKLTQLMNHHNAVVIDIRDANAFAQGHIIGAISILASELEKNNKKIEKHRSRPIVLVCATGVNATRSANKLIAQGFDGRVLAGGMRAWRDANMPTVKE